MDVNAKRQFTIKGLRVEFVEMARTSAKKEGMKLNSWIAKAIQSAAKQNQKVAGPFRLMLFEADRVPSPRVMTGRELHRLFVWPTVPRKGDLIGLSGNNHEVIDVVHDLDSDTLPSVHIAVDYSNFEEFAHDSAWQRRHCD